MGKVVVIGSSNTDMVVTTATMPKPGETVFGTVFNVHQGGKGANQAVAAARAGAQVTFIAKVGNDEFGQNAISAYQQDGIDTSHVLVDDQLSTGVAMITVDQTTGENSIIVVSGANAALLPDEVKGLEDVIRSADVLLVQLEIQLETVKTALALAKKYGVKTILNPAPAGILSHDLLKLVDILIPNETEAEQLSGRQLLDMESKKRVVSELLVHVDEAVILTMGAQGVLLKMKNENEQIITAQKVKAIDTTAAGDVFCGYLASCLSDNVAITEAIEVAKNAAAIAVTRRGAQPSIPFINELSKSK
ncbi:ribokinase [Carboxylicivirga mesophila]|uniref:Ribokinase n=1 Tax=Carboxylicivirga mesophila TaxID=1166478 RepID=A0ABS5K8U6_9BACT|nr:ribokinase [Carboxylicivirga mesophila]MBS2211416.1 ribokinase [Carboxylicivirga mesophila]